MTPGIVWIVVLLVAAFLVFWNAHKIVEWRQQIKKACRVDLPSEDHPTSTPVPPDDGFEARVRRLRTVRDLIRELDEVGAKTAVSKARGLAATMIDDDFLR